VASEKPTVVVVFILSAPRSGSTWLNLVLGSHSWAMNLGEYYRPFLHPGHIVCRLCEADGLSECTMLHGIAAIDRVDAYHFAASRSGQRVLIDASKRLDWSRDFLGRSDIDARLIHLVRHPCGFVESEGRRAAADLSPTELLSMWENVNRSIDEFIAGAGAPSYLACYDDLANDPHRHFPPLCAFIGYKWEASALSYWTVSHHGLGGNGAASVYLRGRKLANYLTGDDAFYVAIDHRPTAADRRWKERLPEDFCRQAVASPYALAVRERLGERIWEI
jgi:hypothetical protein